MGCDLNECQLKDDVAEIKLAHNETQKIVGGMAVGVGKMSQKLDDYMERGKDEHDALFRRTSLTVKWPHLAGALSALGIIVAIVWKFAGG